MAAVIGFVKYGGKVWDWFKKQNGQNSQLEELRKHYDEDIKAIKEEQTLVVYGVLACLKGLKEQGCNGPVTEAIDKIDKYLNKKAHE